MSFLYKAKRVVKDVQEINAGLKKMGVDTSSIIKKGTGGKSSTTAESTAASATPSTAPIATPSSLPPSSSAAPSPPPVASPDSSAAPASEPLGPLVPRDPASTSAKIPLAMRKSLRDNFEIFKTEREQELSKILGEPWRIFADTAGIFTYAHFQEKAQVNLGGTIHSYFENANYHIKNFVEDFGDDGRNKLNDLAYKHMITLEPTSDQSIPYGGGRIEGGRLIILFRDDQLGTNNRRVFEDVSKIVHDAGTLASGSGKSSNDARNSIKTDYDSQVAEVLRSARESLASPIEFNPNSELNYAAVAASGSQQRPDWEKSFGIDTLDYFKGFVSAIRDNGFHKDDMLQEGFNDSVDKHIVSLLVVDKIDKGPYELVIEDGVLVMKTTPEHWGSDTGVMCANIIDLL